MQVGFGLSLEITQRLVMTPELRQAIAILQMSAMELGQYLDQELQSNPMLEIKDEASDGEEKTEVDPVERDLEWEEYFQNRSDLGVVSNPKAKVEEVTSFDNYVATVPSLMDHLRLQLELSPLGKRQRQVGEYLLGLLDGRGYLPSQLDEVSQRFKMTNCQVEAVVKVLQGFDPAGIAARDLQECLTIQLDQLGIDNDIVDSIIAGFMDELADGRLTKIADRLGCAVGDVQVAVDLIRTLDPKPGSKYGNPNDNRYIIPDLVVERVGKEYVIVVNDATAPRLTMSGTYQGLLKDGGLDEDTAKYLRGRMEAAYWLVKSIEQRRMTLYRVMDCIVQRQRSFFDHGVQQLRPLTLKDVAEEVGVHESTVSRATSHKYAQTPRGIFELKFFFTNGLENTAGGTLASDSVRLMIKDMIAKEDTKKPLSDQALTKQLCQEGVVIARRTVAKYREELGINASAKRKRYS